VASAGGADREHADDANALRRQLQSRADLTPNLLSLKGEGAQT
jgi:hypothetical protein